MASKQLFSQLTTIDSCEAIGGGIFRARLSLPESTEFGFSAGQYLLLALEGEDKRPFSIASAPQALPEIELHIRELPGNEFTEMVIEKLQNSKTIDIDGPLGKAVINNSTDKEVTMIVGGTGFAPAKSMIEDLIAKNSDTVVNLFWGARNREEIYALDLAQQWHLDDSPVNFTPVIFEHDENWQGDTGLVHEIAMEKMAETLHNHEIYIAGSAEMVLAVYRDLLADGVAKDCIHSDILDLLREQGELE